MQDITEAGCQRNEVATKPPNDAGEGDDYEPSLKGTTYRVYRFMLKQRNPVGISEVQKSLGLSSPSVSQYHIRKLIRLHLVREEGGGYVVDKVVFENVIRVRRTAIPTQTAYVAFFGVTLIIMLVFLRPSVIDSLYFFALAVNCTALGISSYEMMKTFRRF